MDEKLLEKIKKLLSLANSPNESEAKLAMDKANELLIRHNFSFSDIKTKVEYEDKVVFSQVTEPKHIKYINEIVQHFFFVKVILTKSPDPDFSWRTRRGVKLVGKPLNVAIATYVYSYLQDLFPKLFIQYKKEQRELGYYNANERWKNSYYHGLKLGICNTLMNTKWRLEEEKGLVVVDDPELKQYVDDLTSGKVARTRACQIIKGVAEGGFRDGQKVKIAKPIESSSNHDNEVLSIETKRT